MTADDHGDNDGMNGGPVNLGRNTRAVVRYPLAPHEATQILRLSEHCGLDGQRLIERVLPSQKQ
jgi:hypothetical protein